LMSERACEPGAPQRRRSPGIAGIPSSFARLDR
jgi:hypothetical protein